MSSFTFYKDGKVVTIVYRIYYDATKCEYVEEFKIKEDGTWRRIGYFEAFDMLKKAIEEGQTIEYCHAYYDAYADDWVEIHEPISTLEKLKEAFGMGDEL